MFWVESILTYLISCSDNLSGLPLLRELVNFGLELSSVKSCSNQIKRKVMPLNLSAP